MVPRALAHASVSMTESRDVGSRRLDIDAVARPHPDNAVISCRSALATKVDAQPIDDRPDDVEAEERPVPEQNLFGGSALSILKQESVA